MLTGPEEELPRKMECFEFVCHTPSEYFKARHAPYPTRPIEPELGYVWTSLGYRIKPAPHNDEIYGLRSPKQESLVKERSNKALDREKKAQEKDRKEKERRESAKEKREARREGRRERIKTEIL